jgi:hypothetical protein
MGLTDALSNPPALQLDKPGIVELRLIGGIRKGNGGRTGISR